LKGLSNQMNSESDLIKGCIQGDRKMQYELYERFAPKMYGVCLRYAANAEEAEDILQEGFIKVFNNLKQYKNDGELGAWIRRIMVNTAINYLKKKSRYMSDLSFSDVTLHPVIDDDPGVKMSAKELAELIRQLPIGYQTIFNLHAVEGYSHVEIGQMLGIHEGTSRSQYARARGLLINWLKKNSLDNKAQVYAQQGL